MDAYVAAAMTIDSDYELGRALEDGRQRDDRDAAGRWCATC